MIPSDPDPSPYPAGEGDASAPGSTFSRSLTGCFSHPLKNSAMGIRTNTAQIFMWPKRLPARAGIAIPHSPR